MCLYICRHILFKLFKSIILRIPDLDISSLVGRIYQNLEQKLEGVNIRAQPEFYIIPMDYHIGI